MPQGAGDPGRGWMSSRSPLASTPDPAGGPVHDAFRQTDPETRYRACRRAAAEAPFDPALALALGSACMETGRLDECDETLAAAAAGAGDWEAVHYEQGKPGSAATTPLARPPHSPRPRG